LGDYEIPKQLKIEAIKELHSMVIDLRKELEEIKKEK
jgi:hypothetical protein